MIETYANAETISIASDTIPGKKIKVIGTIKNEDGKPVVNALVYSYHTDSHGWYAADAPHVNMNEGDMRHVRLFGFVRTDKDGKFGLHRSFGNARNRFMITKPGKTDKTFEQNFSNSIILQKR